MVGVEVKSDGFRRACDEFLTGLERVSSDSVRIGAKSAEQEALLLIRRNTKRHTGTLENSTYSFQSSSRTAFFTSRAPYANFIDAGTRAHIIQARRAQFLRFEVGGVVHFRRSVRHPGTAPRPFVKQAMIVGQLAMRTSAEVGVDGIASRWNRDH